VNEREESRVGAQAQRALQLLVDIVTQWIIWLYGRAGISHATLLPLGCFTVSLLSASQAAGGLMAPRGSGLRR